MASNTKDSLLSRHYIDYVYMPAVLLIIGTLIVKKEWLPYSAALSLVLGAYNFWNFREFKKKILFISQFVRVADSVPCRD